MMLMRKRMASPTLSTKSCLSPILSLRSIGSPQTDLCPPTPQWECSPTLDSLARSPVFDTQAQIAWTAYQGCSRRINSACVINRTQSVEEQRSWWEETSSICRNAIMLHSATLYKNYDLETARNLELLENAYHVVQTTLDSLASRQDIPVEEVSISRSNSTSLSSAPTLVGDDIEPMKRSKRLAFAAILGRFKQHLTTRESKFEVEQMDHPDAWMY